jgi:sensor histidine kinase YesM
MHPILSHRGRLLLYFAVWIAFGGLLAAIVAATGQTDGASSLLFAEPLALLLGFECLFCWYLVRVLPVRETPPWRLISTWVGAAVGDIAIWVVAGYAWSEYLRAYTQTFSTDHTSIELAPLLIFTGAVGFTVCVLAHYLADAFERSRAAERRALELQVLAREAELKALRSQLDPHFLFNSLNSVAALIGSDAPAARRMCFLMADFFRSSMTLGGQISIPLSEELRLARTFLDIETIRFGARLQTSFDVAEDSLTLSVPPLVLQPLVENAVHHGVAHLLEGGEIKVRARRRQGLLEIAVENPVDPDRPASRGAGVGLQNVRTRIDTLFGNRGSVDVDSGSERFRVSILLPCAP